MLFMALMSWVVVALPPAATWDGQAAYESVFGQVPRIVFASIAAFWAGELANSRSEEHTSELQSLMRISYAVFCLKKKKQKNQEKKMIKYTKQYRHELSQITTS